MRDTERNCKDNHMTQVGFHVAKLRTVDDLTRKIFECGTVRTRRTRRRGHGMKTGYLQDANSFFLMFDTDEERESGEEHMADDGDESELAKWDRDEAQPR